MTPEYRVGHGLDSHRLVAGRPLILGGVTVPGSPRGPEAHSDGDVLLHAVADALLSCFALGDIGKIFPPSDPAHAGLDSRVIVAAVLQRVRARAPGAVLVNVAAVVTLDAPKLGPVRENVAQSVAGLLGLAPEDVGITFKTSEGLAPDHVQASVTLLTRVV
ncbi:MAG TPA: 2-C-methyl-D-erythritol 2,4-cyclodiphosphate synthase [Trueperaceae bacterium]|nr:2-C-methyl-D-erythritol 2,4-cyclodiphosphate synthase [Trueperaceae bacterium]